MVIDLLEYIYKFEVSLRKDLNNFENHHKVVLVDRFPSHQTASTVPLWGSAPPGLAGLSSPAIFDHAGLAEIASGAINRTGPTQRLRGTGMGPVAWDHSGFRALNNNHCNYGVISSGMAQQFTVSFNRGA
ncbi:hypothetical protein [Phyllobacterium phragmitis]|nr:hypothetical protein [Phyllobacterium phragmitis]